VTTAPDPRTTANLTTGVQAKPKPYSVERRFQLMRSGTVALALLLISCVLYGNHSFKNGLATSLRQLNTALALNRAIHSDQENSSQAFWDVYDLRDFSQRGKYEQESQEGMKLAEGYESIPLSEEEKDEVSRLRALQIKFVVQTGGMLVNAPTQSKDSEERAKVGRLDTEIEGVLGRLEDLQVRRLDMLNTEVGQSTKWLTVLLLVFAVFELLTTVWFRRAHQNHLWNHLEELREMVGEVREGNLDVSCEVPPSVELGSLIGAFIEMAADLREMRNSLERKVVERTAKLEYTQRELLQTAKLASLGQLVCGVAHEINNPLTSILGFSEIMLGQHEIRSELRGPLVTIREHALRLRELVANLNSFARRAPHRTVRIDLRTVMGRLADLRANQLRVDNITLHVSQADKPVWVTADSDQLLQVVVNLVINAEHAIREGGAGGDIWLNCKIAEGSARLEVKDNGPGMAPEVREHIFEPFFTTKPPGSGTGLGLSISHGVIQQHGGTILAESAPGAGTRMRIELPLSAQEPASKSLPTMGSASSGKAAAPATVHALVIDDEEDILELIRYALKPLHCHTTLLQSSAGVKAALEQNDFDFVICDLKMPGENGLDIYRLVRGMRNHLAEHFLLMTGNLADADDHAAELADVPILAKPFTIARLREAVEQLLSAQKQA
jgi:signal transduction histidine kinase/CheY-like chemotaxis protein